MAKKIVLISTLILIAISIAIFRPVPIVPENEALVESGKVKSIFEAGVKDVVFILEDNKRRFYINRGLENGLELDTLREKLIGKKVIIKYPDYWTPLDWNDKVKHLSKLELNGEIIFDELKPSE